MPLVMMSCYVKNIRNLIKIGSTKIGSTPLRTSVFSIFLLFVFFISSAQAERVAPNSAPLEALPIYDTHLHYNRWDASLFKPDTILRKLKNQRIPAAWVTSNPPLLVQTLKKRGPHRIHAWLGVYEGAVHKNNWLNHTNLPERMADNFSKGTWAGIGELHLFGKQRFEPVFEKVVTFAQGHQLPLLLHCDPVVIDHVFKIAPNSRVVWAHAGKYPYPPLLRDYLARYPNLWIDVSVREALIAPNNQLHEDWEMLFTEWPTRFLMGVDTYSVNRWAELNQVTERIRAYLSQLPLDTQRALAYENAQSLFKLKQPNSVEND